MANRPPQDESRVPYRGLALACAALLVPVLGTLVFPDALGEAGALLWLLALIPAFLMSYYRGWRGMATSLAIGMVVLASTQVAAVAFDRQVPGILFWVVLAYIGITFALGWVTELLHREREGLEDLALTDILTHLPNRRHARVFLDNEFGAAQRGHLLAVTLFDLDGFKDFNDRHGHRAGDDALRRFAQILASTTRRMNLSARFGGEEFLTVLANADEDGAVIFANRVREALENTSLPQGRLTVSAGVAAYHPSMNSPDELIAAADLALYRAKRDGRNCVRIFGRSAAESAESEPPTEMAESAVAPGTGASALHGLPSHTAAPPHGAGDGDEEAPGVAPTRRFAQFSFGTRASASNGNGGGRENASSSSSSGEGANGDGTPGSESSSGQDSAEPERGSGSSPSSHRGESLRLGDGSGRYPRTDEEMGGVAPASELLPSELSRFGEDRRVLVVEDDPAIRKLLDSFLGREGFSVVTASDASAAIEALDDEFDVVITDVRLPGASGNELVAILKSRWPATQVIVMTGAREAQVAAEALNAGADRYLFKPFGLHELQAHLSDSLARRDRTLAERRERRELSAEAELRSAEAREAILKGARALVRAVEVRDTYTRGHSDRVATYAATIARALGDRAADIDMDTLRLACELHDVGKIGISDAILNKDGPLNPEEFVQVQKHPATGRRILEPLLGDELILAVTTWHHERWDGKGYPDGLAGEAIPFPARIVAVADALDAMTSTRAYRSALPWEAAVEQILERGGSQFDPDLIAPFRTALPELESLARAATHVRTEE